jgi:hypothetical protein
MARRESMLMHRYLTVIWSYNEKCESREYLLTKEDADILEGKLTYPWSEKELTHFVTSDGVYINLRNAKEWWLE